MGLLEEAAAAVTGAERRIDIHSRNIANSQTPGYKKEISYNRISATFVSDLVQSPQVPVVESAIFSAPGVLTESGNALDIAVRGDGYFLLRSGDIFFLSRGGQFRRDRDGVIVDGQGRILQQAGGGDLVLDTDAPEILADGTVLSDKVPVGNIGLYSCGTEVDATTFRAGMSHEALASLTESEDAEIAQGMIERSNVILSDEMIGLMRTQRLAEAGAQLVRAYDQLTGQAISTFGRKGG